MRTSEIILWAFLKQKGRKTKGKINFVNFQWAFNVRARNRQTQTIIWFRLWFRSPCQCSTYLFAMTIMNHDDDESLSASFYSSTRRVCVCAIWKVFFPSTYLLLFHFILLTVLWCAHTRNSISSFAFQNARRRFNFFLLLLLLFFLIFHFFCFSFDALYSLFRYRYWWCAAAARRTKWNIHWYTTTCCTTWIHNNSSTYTLSGYIISARWLC